MALLVLAGCWTVPGAGPSRSGHNPFEPILTPANVGLLSPEWTWQAEWDTPRAVLDPIASPSGVHITVGHKLVTVDPASGAESWRAVLFDAGTAEQIPIGAGAPSFAAGRLLVSVTVYRDFVAGSGTHSYDASTGANLGAVARSAGGGAIPRGGRLFGVYGDIVGSGIGISGYFVVDETDPTKSWNAHLSVGTFSFSGARGPAVSDDGFFLTSENSLLAYPLTRPAGCFAPVPTAPYVSCPPTWDRTFGRNLTRPSVTNDGQVVFVGDDGNLWAIQAATGADLWSGPLPTTEAPSAPISADDDHAFVATAGKLVAFARAGCGAASCDPRWSADTGGQVFRQPAIAGGVVYTASATGVLRAFAADGCGLSTCAPLWEYDVGVEITGAPAVSGGRVLVGTVDGRLISFRPGVGTAS